MSRYSGRLGIVQRVLPRYRAPFFEALAARCEGGLHLFAGQPRPAEAISTADKLEGAAFTQGRNIHLLGGALYLCWQPDLISWLESTQPDALILEANPRYVSSARAMRWMRARQRPVIGWGLGAPPPRGPLAGLRVARRCAFLSHFDALIAYSTRGAGEYRNLGFPQERVFVAPNAVVPRPEGPAPARPDQFDGPPRLLFVGRLQPRKGLDRLLRACAALPQALRPRLQIVGDGPTRGALERLAAQVFPGVMFAGALFGAELDEAFDQADLFVLPGTGGLAIQQAMAHALPIIAAQGDGTQEDLVREENGILVTPNDQEALTLALRTLLADAGQLRRMGAASLRRVRERYNLENMVNAFMETLEAVGS